jgi:hypothetical protein
MKPLTLARARAISDAATERRTQVTPTVPVGEARELPYWDGWKQFQLALRLNNRTTTVRSNAA